MVPQQPTGIHGALTSAAVAGVLLLVGCSSASQLESIEQELTALRIQVDELDNRNVTKTELQDTEDALLAEIQRSHAAQARVLDGLESLATTVARLETQLDTSLIRIDQLSQQILATQEEVRQLALPVSLPSVEGGLPPILSSDPKTLYDAGHADYIRGNYELALLAFDEYLRSFPDTELADNALYWTGESYFSQERFLLAITTFADLLARFPASEKATSARMKQGFAHIQRGDSETGIEQLRDLVEDYPLSDEAKLARAQLAILRAN